MAKEPFKSTLGKNARLVGYTVFFILFWFSFLVRFFFLKVLVKGGNYGAIRGSRITPIVILSGMY